MRLWKEQMGQTFSALEKFSRMSVWPQDSHFSQTSARISSRAPLGCRGFFSLRNHAMPQISLLDGAQATHAPPAERRVVRPDGRGELERREARNERGVASLRGETRGEKRDGGGELRRGGVSQGGGW